MSKTDIRNLLLQKKKKGWCTFKTFKAFKINVLKVDQPFFFFFFKGISKYEIN